MTPKGQHATSFLLRHLIRTGNLRAEPAAEELFCGWIDDGGVQVDYQMARGYLARQVGPLQLGAEFERRSAVRSDPLGTR